MVELKADEEEKEFEGEVEEVSKYGKFTLAGVTVAEGKKEGHPHFFSLRDFPESHGMQVKDFAQGDYVKLKGAYKPSRKSVKVIEVLEHKPVKEPEPEPEVEEKEEAPKEVVVYAEQDQEPQDEGDANISPFVHPIVSVEEIAKAFEKFSQIKSKILSEEDYMYVDGQGKWHDAKPSKKTSEYIKKTGWQKLAVAFSLNIKLISKEKTWSKDRRGSYYTWCYTYRISHPSGKYITTEGCCSSRDSFFTKGGWKEPDEADIMHKAQTVAMNRGISALIGGGPSAEEMLKEREE